MKSQQRMTALPLLAARSQRRRQACSRSLRKLIEILMIYVVVLRVFRYRNWEGIT